MELWTVIYLVLVLLVHCCTATGFFLRGRRTSRWYCPDPGTPSNGNRQLPQQRQFSVGSSILYDCNAGYLPQGSPLITCSFNLDKLVAEWNRDPPECIGEIVCTNDCLHQGPLPAFLRLLAIMLACMPV